MRFKATAATITFSALAMVLLILDSKTALSGAADGLDLCMRVVIPSLFPFFFISTLLSSSLIGRHVPFLCALGRLCGIPQGAESLLLTGFLGGYPAGAQCVAQANQVGQLSDTDARRMLGFCSNAGPAFLFGMAGRLFHRTGAVWTLWIIHILSALLIGVLLPEKSISQTKITSSRPVSASQAMTRAIKAMASVCGWVVLFRVILTVAQRWVLWLLPESLRVTVSGVLELSNGVIALFSISNPGQRFVLCSVFLAFGGLCVLMQTLSVTGHLGLGSYLSGKLIQSCLSFLLSSFAQLLLFPADTRWNIPLWVLAAALCFLLAAGILLRKLKNRGSILHPVVV